MAIDYENYLISLMSCPPLKDYQGILELDSRGQIELFNKLQKKYKDDLALRSEIAQGKAPAAANPSYEDLRQIGQALLFLPYALSKLSSHETVRFHMANFIDHQTDSLFIILNANTPKVEDIHNLLFYIKMGLTHNKMKTIDPTGGRRIIRNEGGIIYLFNTHASGVTISIRQHAMDLLTGQRLITLSSESGAFITPLGEAFLERLNDRYGPPIAQQAMQIAIRSLQ